MGDLKFNLSELILLRDSIQSRESELNESLVQINQAKKQINKILADVKNQGKDVVIYLPKETFEYLKNSSESIKSKFNWKSTVLEIIKNSNVDLTTLMIYEKTKIRYPLELSDKKKSIHGISSALSYLRRDGKIEQIKKENKFFYRLLKYSIKSKNL
jgi:Mor family transcriptional regulator